MSGTLRKYGYSLLIPLLFFVYSECPGQRPVDSKATSKTKNLLFNLHRIAEKGVLFGHQDDLAYGVTWRGEAGRSDVKEAAGTYPAVFGWDIGHRLDDSMNIDSVDFDAMKNWMIDIYKMGGINSISWHMTNWTTGGNSWDRTPTVKDVLPGGLKHEQLLYQLDLFADFLNSLKSGRHHVPIVFRPWHEHNGGWFWWGKGNCSEEEYIRLYRFTVDYLRHEKNIHHVLYAFSPDRSQLPLDSIAETHYLYGYPGDSYVDVIGLDDYADVGRGGVVTASDRENFTEALKLITSIARNKNKVAALTETGLEGVTNEKWFTDVILKPLESNRDDIAIACILVWRNANTKHHYAPYAGHASEADFRIFHQNLRTFFQSDLRNPYKKNKALK